MARILSIFISFFTKIFGLINRRNTSTNLLAADPVDVNSIQPLFTKDNDEHDTSDKYLQRFEPDDPKFLEYLKENGYVVIKDVCSPSEICEAKKLFWEFVKSYGLEENDVNTWNNENFRKLGMTGTGILNRGGIQHSKFLWFMRLLPKVKLAFEKIYGTSELITSFDGANFYRPWHSDIFDMYAKANPGWFHVDQGRNLKGFQAVQGQLFHFSDAKSSYSSIYENFYNYLILFIGLVS